MFSAAIHARGMGQYSMPISIPTRDEIQTEKKVIGWRP